MDKDSHLIFEAYQQTLDEGVMDWIEKNSKAIGITAAALIAILGGAKLNQLETEARLKVMDLAQEKDKPAQSILDDLRQFAADNNITYPLDAGHNATNAQTAVPPTPQPVVDNNATNAQFFDMLRANEGLELEAYRDTNNNWTIGIGHHLDGSQEDRNAVAGALTNANLPAVNYDNLIAQTERITEDQARAIFELDLDHHLGIARRLVPQFDNLPGYLQLALGDMAFRTDLQQSPNARQAMNANNWNTAANRYLNSDEYRQSQSTGTGIAPRMDRNADAMRQYAEELEAQQNNR